MRGRIMKKVVKALMTMLVCFTQFMPLQSKTLGDVIGYIDQSAYGVNDVPSGAIYGKAQMQYVFNLHKDQQSIKMGGQNARGIAYLNTAQGSVYCIDPTTSACGSVGNDPADSYTVEAYENELADAMGLIWYYGNQQHAHDTNYMDYVAVTQLMIWELYGWQSELIQGFDHYPQIRNEIEEKLRQHEMKPKWEVVDIQLNADNYPSDQREDAKKINLEMNEVPSFTLKPGDSITFNDVNGVFETYYTDWSSLPSGIKTQRVGKNGIQFKALSGFAVSTIGFTKVDPEVIGHAYLLKPKNNHACQQLVQPYVSQRQSGRVEFMISSEGSIPDHQEMITYPEFVKVDTEKRTMALPNSVYEIFADQVIQVPFTKRSVSCSVNGEGEIDCSEENVSEHQERIVSSNDMLLELTTDYEGKLDLSEIGVAFDKLVEDKAYHRVLANGGYEDYEPSADYAGFAGGKFYLLEKQAVGVKDSYIGYYNDQKKIHFAVDANADQRKIIADNTRQKVKLVLHKADSDDLYLNHNNPLLPQGDASFANAKFEVRAAMDIRLIDGTILYSKGEVVDTICCDEKGIGESIELELGLYTIKEIELPQGYWYYQYDDEPQTITVDCRYSQQEHSLQIYTYNENDLGDTSPFAKTKIHVLNSNDPQKSLVVRNSVQKGHVSIIKFYEGEVGNESAGMPSGKRESKDIYFGIYLNSKVVNNVTADLDESFFMAKQLDGSYESNKAIVDKIAADHEIALCDVYMVLKTDEKGEASTLRPETIVYAATQGKMQNDKTFTKPLPLPYGEYTVIELNTPQGYQPISFQFKVEKVSGALAEDKNNKFNIVSKHQLLENQPSMQKITLSKRDVESGNAIVSDDAVFKIWQWNYNEIFTADQVRTWWDQEQREWHVALAKPSKDLLSSSNQQVWYDETCGKWVNQRLDTLTGMEILSEYRMVEGSILLPQPLAVGKYLLCEIKAPDGYQLSSQPLAFEVEGAKHSVDANDPGYVMVPKLDENGQPVLDSLGNVIQVPVPKNIHLFVDMSNQSQKGRIVIEKSGSQWIGFENINEMFKPVWEVSQLPYGAVFAISAAEDILVNKQVIYTKGELVETIKSDVYGNASTHDLPLGTYLVREIATASGYLTNEQSYEVTLSADGEYQRVFPQFLSIENEHVRPEYSFEKYLSNESGLSAANGAVFGLYADEELTVKTPVKQPSLYDLTVVEEEDLVLTQLGQGYKIEAYLGKETRLEIPNEINGLPIIEIGKEAFYNCHLQSVMIPSHVKKIGQRAFADNQLELVILQPETIIFEADNVFEENPLLKTLEVNNLRTYDQVKIGYGLNAVFDPLDHCCLGLALRLHDASDDVLDEFGNHGVVQEHIEYEMIEEASIEVISIMFMDQTIHVINKIESNASAIQLPQTFDGIAIDGILNLGDSKLEAISIPDSYWYFGESAFQNQAKLKTIQFSVSQTPTQSLIMYLNSFDQTPNLSFIIAEPSNYQRLREHLLIYDDELKSIDEFDELTLPSFCWLDITINTHENNGGVDDGFTLPPHEEILSKDFVTSIPRHTLIEKINVVNGKGMIQSQLPPGKYYLMECQAPQGYILDSKMLPFVVQASDTGSIVLFDQPLINVAKKQPSNPTPASKEPQVKIMLYKAFELDEANAKQELVATFGIYNVKGRLMDTFTSNPSGLGVWQGRLALGDYQVKEMSTAQGYLIDERSFGFTVSGKEETILINEGEAIVNQLKRHTLRLYKTDIDGIPLANAEFTLYDADFEAIAKVVTDEQGLAQIQAKAGTYYLKETKAPMGYSLDDTLHVIDLSSDVELSLINQRGEVMKVYPDTAVKATPKQTNQWLIGFMLVGVVAVFKVVKKR